MKKRLFLALNATDPLSTTFLPTYKKLKINADQKDMTVKWVPPENFHVTVTFLGDITEENIPLLLECLQEACNETRPFDLKVDDVGAFSSEHDARVLWLGIQNKKCLGEFKQLLDQLLEDRKLLTHPEFREFKPHLTFARLRNPHSVKDLISPFKRKSFGKIHVEEIILYESKQAGPFPVYTPISRCKLTGQDVPITPIDFS
ncbi:MAG: RNA 2',3'-cyclic phosphodiesterase [Bacillota bacterium]